MINYGSREYRKELTLRNDLLRKPLGLNLYSEDLTREKDHIHIGAFLDKRLVGTLILTKINDRIIKMRQVAVTGKFQGKGIGSKMINYSESYVKNSGYNTIILHARKTAIKFYQKLGYYITGDEFMEVGIPHFKMQKEVNY